MVFPTPPFPPTKIHFKVDWLMMLFKVGSKGSKSSSISKSVLNSFLTQIFISFLLLFLCQLEFLSSCHKKIQVENDFCQMKIQTKLDSDLFYFCFNCLKFKKFFVMVIIFSSFMNGNEFFFPLKYVY